MHCAISDVLRRAGLYHSICTSELHKVLHLAVFDVQWGCSGQGKTEGKGGFPSFGPVPPALLQRREAKRRLEEHCGGGVGFYALQKHCVCRALEGVKLKKVFVVLACRCYVVLVLGWISAMVAGRQDNQVREREFCTVLLLFRRFVLFRRLS